MSEPMSVPADLLRTVFDVAVNSLDFGSGFLDDAEVTALRSVAAILGVDPMVATPENFQCRFGGAHVPWRGTDECSKCGAVVRDE